MGTSFALFYRAGLADGSGPVADLSPGTTVGTERGRESVGFS